MQLYQKPVCLLFQSTYLYKVRHMLQTKYFSLWSFNPRTYIRYDSSVTPEIMFYIVFQSTYLYKVRQTFICHNNLILRFQSTYLYKVRHRHRLFPKIHFCFNPRTYIRYDGDFPIQICMVYGFNPRTYIRYDLLSF